MHPFKLASGWPSITIPSAVALTCAPQASKPVSIAAIRSDSFTLSSSAPRTIVCPCAKHAATNNTGNSSIAKGTIDVGTSMPRSWLDLTRRSATGSPPTTRGLITSISAPISLRMSTTPIRVRFMPTCSRIRSEPGTIDAATRKNAAEEISAGTSISQPCSVWPPFKLRLAPSISTLTPKPPNIRSVWSLVGAGSVMRVWPCA